MWRSDIKQSAAGGGAEADPPVIDGAAESGFPEAGMTGCHNVLGIDPIQRDQPVDDAAHQPGPHGDHLEAVFRVGAGERSLPVLRKIRIMAAFS